MSVGTNLSLSAPLRWLPLNTRVDMNSSPRLVRGIQTLSHPIPHPVVTIGNFDGVHLGHQHIIKIAIEKARARQGHCVAFTFRPHPQVALWPGTRLQLLSSYDEKLELLLDQGVDSVIEEPFSRQFSETEPEQFFTNVLLRGLSAEVIVVGYDFAFGKGRHGHLEALEKFCVAAGVELIVVPPQKVEGEVVSSSKIRQHLLAGEIEQANRLLGRKFSYQGTVIKGDGRGKTIGFPTANLKLLTLENKIPLPYGVYVTCAEVGDQVFSSVTNVGLRPTFHSPNSAAGASESSNTELVPQFPALVETHLLDVSLDLYGATIEVSFLRRLRDERKFDGVESLKKQIAQDVFAAREYLNR